jgi:glycosyltransferase involved in cell wall biosynthesis
VVLLHDTLFREQMPALYGAVHAYVAPSRAPGWCGDLMEAMACGLPVIGTGWGNHTEILNEENADLIRHDLVDVPDRSDSVQGSSWAKPSLSHLRSLLRGMFEDREKAVRMGEAGKRQMASRFDWSRVNEQIHHRLCTLWAERTSMEKRHEKEASPRYRA